MNRPYIVGRVLGQGLEEGFDRATQRGQRADEIRQGRFANRPYISIGLDAGRMTTDRRPITPR